MTEPTASIKVPPIRVEEARELRLVGPPPMVIEELLPTGSITFISGAKYTGKTFFALEAARAVATAPTPTHGPIVDPRASNEVTGASSERGYDPTKFMGKWRIERPGNVLIVEQDSPRYDTGRALWCMLAKQYAEEDAAIRDDEGSLVDPIYISWHPDLDLLKRLDAMRVVQTANDLYTWRGEASYERPEVDERGDVIRSCEYHDFGYRGASLIVLDSARALNRGKENESDDMEIFVQNLKYIRQHTGAAIIVIAHDNAGGTKTRGSTAIEAGADSEYNITKRRAKKDHGVHVRKARAIAPQEFRYTITTEEDETLGTIKRIEFKEFIEEFEQEGAREQLMAFIATGPKELQRDLAPWAEANALKERTMKEYLTDAVETGYLVTSYRNEGRKRFAIYAVKGAL